MNWEQSADGKWKSQITEADKAAGLVISQTHSRRNKKTANAKGDQLNYIVLEKLKDFFGKYQVFINYEANKLSFVGEDNFLWSIHPKVKCNTSGKYRSVEKSFIDKHGDHAVALFVQIYSDDKTLKNQNPDMYITGFLFRKDIASHGKRYQKGSLLANGTARKSDMIEVHEANLLHFTKQFIERSYPKKIDNQILVTND